ncbi:DUF5131 family protein [Mesorhizobium captivum]|uniref:DUF5131 family protein n=1 Tax=Mesorhizobium captivum TaxID=3072319 RepID=UPI002A24509F|nr:phage Gp37/Gp68 family protein [Mesorhizobium sp. VK23E]MDX8513587.1 phage Gp37/Gp68 family protein [Mesorhizobium sp. VK23E]
MADHSSIEWTDATWNPITGCSIVSPGCTNCYAMRLAGTRLKNIDSRKGLTRDTKAGPVWTGEVRLNKQWLYQPFDWKKPRRVFVCAHGDLFAENVPDDWILDVFTVMAAASHHTYQVLTKRADRMLEFVSRRDLLDDIYANWYTFSGGAREVQSWPLHNIWLGVSAEDQKRADDRVPHLLETPAKVRFVSAEPLLGPIEFRDIWDGLNSLNRRSGPTLDWIIVGGESGRDARPMHPDWARSIRDQCAATGVPFFFKQWGAWRETGYQLCAHPLPAGMIAPAPPHWVGAGYGLDRPSMAIENIGKKAAGRLLDGVEHNAFPEVAA